MTDKEQELLQHMLGNETMYRNRYFCPPDSDADIALQGMLERGLVEKGRILRTGRYVYVSYYATERGKALAWQKKQKDNQEDG